MSGEYTFEIPIVMKFGKEGTYRITMTRNSKEDDEDFWTALREKIELLEPMLADHHFGNVKAEDLEMLQLASGLMPKLLGQGGRLLYEAKEKDRINKSQYKEYLGRISANLSNMLAKRAEDVKNATNQDLLTAQAVVVRLQDGMPEKILITHGEHSKISSQQTAFHASAIEVVRNCDQQPLQREQGPAN